MGIIGGEIGYRLLRRLAPPRARSSAERRDYEGRSKIETLLGAGVWNLLRDRVVFDFGCGTGTDAIEIARCGAARVIGLDLQERFLQIARRRAWEAGVADRCVFADRTDERADVILSLDAFEHFADPVRILTLIYDLLKPGGWLLTAFGPTWYHPRGGHLFSIFPWAHLLFTERALLRWRSDFIHDGARRFHEVRGGLNQMTVGRFEKLVAASPFEIEAIDALPIRALRPFACRLTREFTTSFIRATLRRPVLAPSDSPQLLQRPGERGALAPC
jgi:SAM-dependent methyltransferase